MALLFFRVKDTNFIHVFLVVFLHVKKLGQDYSQGAFERKRAIKIHKGLKGQITCFPTNLVPYNKKAHTHIPYAP